MSELRTRSTPRSARNGEKEGWSGLPQEGITQLEEFEALLIGELEHTTLFRSPLLTLTHFVEGTVHHVIEFFRYVFANQTCRRLLIHTAIMLFIWYLISGVVPQFLAVTNDTLEAAVFCTWWFTLGVLSSIGFGTGLHSGILYAFPYVAQTTLVANYCGCLPAHGIFKRAVPSLWEPSSHCPCTPSADPTASVPLFDIFKSVAPALFLWGLGTAVGEVPPFYAARFAARSDSAVQSAELNEVRAAIFAARKEHLDHGDSVDEVLRMGGSAAVDDELHSTALNGVNGDGTVVRRGSKVVVSSKSGVHDRDGDGYTVRERGRDRGRRRSLSVHMPIDDIRNDGVLAQLAASPYQLFERTKIWMVGLIQSYGFVAVVVFGAWPNIAFDMVGMTCGYLGMSLFSFLTATILAKGVIKVTGQIVLLIALFHGGTHVQSNLREFAHLIDSLVPDFILVWLAPEERGRAVEAALDAALNEFKASVDPVRASVQMDAHAPHRKNTLLDVASIVFVALTAYFVKCVIEAIARHRLRESQKERLHKFKKILFARYGMAAPQ